MTAAALRAAPPGHGSTPRADTALARAEWLYRNRRQRDRSFPMANALFAEPAFDLLLDLFIHGERGRPVSVSGATIAAAVPTTTALRWIATLIDFGLAERLPDAKDRRRSLLRLSSSGRSAVLAYLDDW